MYLATFGHGEDAVVLGCVGFPSVPASATWWATYRQLAGHIDSVGWTGATMRIVVEPSGAIRQTMTVAAPATRVSELRRFLATFSRLETIVAGSVTLPVERDEFDQLCADFPAARHRVDRPVDIVSDAWVACNFRVGPSLSRLVEEANTFGYAVGYQANVIAVDRHEGWAKEALKNVLRLRSIAGVPAGLVALQQRLADDVLDCAGVVDEFVGVETGPAQNWLAEFMQRRFREEFGPLHLEPPVWPIEVDAYAGELSVGAVGDADSISAADATAAAVTSLTLPAIFDYQPPPSVLGRAPLPVPSGGGDDEMISPIVPADAPPAYTGTSPFAFVSYKRADLPRISPFVAGLQQRGINLWYDRAIPGGVEWNAMLEAHLDACSGVVLFLTQAAVDSRFVRRELIYADGLGKPIVAVQLEQARLHSGTGLQLGALQILNGNQHDVLDHLQSILAFAR